MFTIDAGELSALGRAFTTASELVPEELFAAFPALDAQVSTMAVSAIKDVTPIGQPNPFYPDQHPGGLGDSTRAISRVEGMGLTIDVDQPARSHPNLDGSGGGFPYVLAVLDGRAAMIAPSSGPWSTGKRAFLTPWGPRKSVRASAPNPYPTQAEPAIATATGLIAERWAGTVLRALLA